MGRTGLAATMSHMYSNALGGRRQPGHAPLRYLAHGIIHVLHVQPTRLRHTRVPCLWILPGRPPFFNHR